MQLTSPAFHANGPIPAKYTCEEKNISPPLKWSGVPAQAQSLTLLVEDPDAPAGTWVHWVVYNLSPKLSELPEDQPRTPTTAEGAEQGVNDFKHVGYGGPCPPRGKPHHYVFKLYALNTVLNLKPGASKKDVERAMEKHMLAQAQLVGTYQRR